MNIQIEDCLKKTQYGKNLALFLMGTAVGLAGGDRDEPYIQNKYNKLAKKMFKSSKNLLKKEDLLELKDWICDYYLNNEDIE